MPAVASCSKIMRLVLVMRWMFIPRSREEKMAFITGWEVRFGVWMNMSLLACLKSCRMNKLRGVGGGFDVVKG